MLAKYDFGVPGIAECVSESMVNVLSIFIYVSIFRRIPMDSRTSGAFLGYQWEQQDASGQQSIQWRKTWENNRNVDMRRRLIQYNQQDCEALRTIVCAIREMIRTRESRPTSSCVGR